MADLIDTLRQLQELDSKLYTFHRQQEQKPLELEQAKQVVAEQEAKARAAEAHLKQLQLQHKEREIELATQDATVKKLQLQLLQVKTNKEYTALQHEIEQTKADISLIEEGILQVLESIDQAASDRRAQLAQLEQRRVEFQQQEARLAQELKAVEEQVAGLQRHRQEIMPLVQREALSLYERTLASRDGLAMVPLVNESCGGCHMVQPPQIVNEAYLRAKLVTCDNCNRILYVEDSSNAH